MELVELVTIGLRPGLDLTLRLSVFGQGPDFVVCSFSKRMATHNFWLGSDFAVCSLSKCVEPMHDGCVWVVGWHYALCIMFRV